MAYGDSTQFQPPTPTQKAEAQAKLQQARQENLAVQQQRQQAPGTIKSGSPQDIAVRAEAAKVEQQRMVEEHVSQKGSSADRYTQAREQALKSGTFSYSSFGQQVPQSFVTEKGQRVERQTLPMTQGGNARSPVMRTAVTLPPAPKPSQSTDLLKTTMKTGTSPVIQISQAPQGQIGVTTLFGKTFKTFTPTSEKQTGEVSSFLKVPFAGQKAQGGEVPATSLADVFAFMPIGSLEKGAVSAGKELAGVFTRAFSREAPKTAEQAAKAGTSDIGLNVPKYTEKFRTEKNIQSMISEKMKTPPASMAREGKEITPTPEITISLGRGTGKVVSGGKGSTSILEGTGKPPTTPTEKTVSAGKGLEQIVRQKPVSKTVQRQKPEFEQKQLSKQEQFLKDQEKAKTEQKAKTEEKLKQKQEQSLIERTGLRYVKTTQPEQKQTTISLTVPKPRQTTREKQVPQPIIPLITPIPPVTRQTQRQKPDMGIFIPPTLTTSPPIFIPPPRIPTTTPSPPTKTPPTEQPPPEKKKPPPDLGVLGIGSSGGLIGKVGKGGARREFIGNVPTTEIVGVYKRGELTYGEKSVTRAERGEVSKASTGKFIQKKSSRIL